MQIDLYGQVHTFTGGMTEALSHLAHLSPTRFNLGQLHLFRQLIQEAAQDKYSSWMNRLHRSTAKSSFPRFNLLEEISSNPLLIQLLASLQ